MTPSVRPQLLASGLALIVLVLALGLQWRSMQLTAKTAELQQARRELQFAAERAAQEQLQGRREEMIRVVRWLDDFYRSPDGLQRRHGLWLPQSETVDAEAIAVWILDVYLPARVGGASEETARQGVIDQIRATEEWRRRHPAP
jgi:hypothetical protein